MAASIKFKWNLRRTAKFLNDGEKCTFVEHDQESQELEFSSKGRWKIYSGENKDLVLAYLESDHILLTKQDIILESVSLPCSQSCLKGVAKGDSLLMSYQLQDGNVRRFKMQFESVEDRRQCTDMLKTHVEICGEQEDAKKRELVDVNELLLDKMKCRKGYSVTVPKQNLKEILTLCLTDSTFPTFVDEIDQLLKNVGKDQ